MKPDEKTFDTRKRVKPALPFFASFGAFVGMGVYMGVNEKPGGGRPQGFFSSSYSSCWCRRFLQGRTTESTVPGYF